MKQKNRLISFIIPDSKFASKAFRVNLIICLGLVLFLFLSLLDQQNKTTNPNFIRGNLQKEGLIFETGQWDVRFLHCDQSANNVRSCVELQETQSKIQFPARVELEKIVKALPEKSNVAIAKYKISEAERKWISQFNVVDLALPRSVQNSVKVISVDSKPEQHGLGANLSFSLYSRPLLDKGFIELEFDFDGFSWFGPADLPVAFAQPDSVAEYEALTLRQISAANLSRQMDIGFPLLLAAIAIVLDHSILFGFLSLYAGSRALRTFIPFHAENGGELSVYLQYGLYCVNGATLAFLILFICEISSIPRKNWKYSTLFVLFCTLLFAGIGKVTSTEGTADNIFWLTADAWSDFIGCVVAIPIMIFSFIKLFKENKNAPKSEDLSKEETHTQLSFALVIVRNGIVFVALFIHAWANASDLLKVSEVQFKNMLDWKHSLLFPALIAAALMEIGSTARKMLNFGREMAAKALIEKDLAVGQEVQHRMLPAMRYSGSEYSWRAFYHPATALAGDWFDVRILKFSDGKELLAACIADVTGHGVGSSLATSVISSHWGLWCREIEKGVFPADNSTRESLIPQAPERINSGLLALRKNENCTAIFLLLDASDGTFTLCSAAHPGLVVGDSNSIRYLFTSGDRLGIESSETERWKAKSDKLNAGELICAYSDGILPPNITVSQWSMAIKRAQKKAPQSVALTLAKQIRANKLAFEADKDIEDDMTLLVMGVGKM